jgi:hypothetical protein
MAERITFQRLRVHIADARDIGLSWAEIALALNTMGYRRHGGEAWTGATVRHATTSTRRGYVPRRRGRPPAGS